MFDTYEYLMLSSAFLTVIKLKQYGSKLVVMLYVPQPLHPPHTKTKNNTT
jgi:hypothetical protein